MTEDKICGTCKWHQEEPYDHGWVCTNGASLYCADWTEYEHMCEEWEGEE